MGDWLKSEEAPEVLDGKMTLIRERTLSPDALTCAETRALLQRMMYWMSKPGEQSVAALKLWASIQDLGRGKANKQKMMLHAWHQSYKVCCEVVRVCVGVR